MLTYDNERLGVEVKLLNDDSFLLIKETLTRIGIASYKTKTLWQSCHILHKQGHYYIMHFKEMFKLDGKPSVLSLEDATRRYAIVKMLIEWGLCTTDENIPEIGRAPKINIIRHSDKMNWNLSNKYSIGNTA